MGFCVFWSVDSAQIHWSKERKKHQESGIVMVKYELQVEHIHTHAPNLIGAQNQPTFNTTVEPTEPRSVDDFFYICVHSNCDLTEQKIKWYKCTYTQPHSRREETHSHHTNQFVRPQILQTKKYGMQTVQSYPVQKIS